MRIQDYKYIPTFGVGAASRQYMISAEYRVTLKSVGYPSFTNEWILGRTAQYEGGWYATPNVSDKVAVASDALRSGPFASRREATVWLRGIHDARTWLGRDETERALKEQENRPV